MIERDQKDKRRQIGLAEDRRNVAAPDPARHDGRLDRCGRVRTRRGRRRGGRDGRGSARFRRAHRLGIRHVKGREGRTADGRLDHERVVRQRGGDAVLGIRQQSAGQRLGAQVAVDRAQGHPGPGRDDLAPAEPLRVRTLGERDRHGRRPDLLTEPCLERAHLAHRRQATGAQRERQARFGEAEVERSAIDRQGDRPADLVAGCQATSLDLVVGHGPVPVQIEILTRLEGRDLGVIDHDVEQDPIDLDADLGVVIDREVAERMSAGGRGHGRSNADRDGDGEQAKRGRSTRASHAGRVRATVRSG